MSVTLHTDVGDIKVELFCEQCPKACENFLALCASDYYNGCLFHRNIKGQKYLATLRDLLCTTPVHQQCTKPNCADLTYLCLRISSLVYEDFLTMFSFTEKPVGFIVQTGDPTGTGKGGSSIWSKKFEDEFHEELKHNARGILSMANNGPNTNGSQFFFTYGEQPHLDLKYTMFGRIIDGFEALDDLEKMPVNPKTFKPLTEARITSVTIHANPLAG